MTIRSTLFTFNPYSLYVYFARVVAIVCNQYTSFKLHDVSINGILPFFHTSYSQKTTFLATFKAKFFIYNLSIKVNY